MLRRKFRCHLPADEDGVGEIGQALQDADLVLDLRAADDGDEEALGALEQAGELAKLALEQEAGVGR